MTDHQLAQADKRRRAPQVSGTVDEDFQHVAEVFAQQVAHSDGGASLAVFHHGELVVDLWGGYRTVEGDPWTRDTLAMCFSTTKGVAATAAHVLADRGQLDYDAKVAAYWPEFAQNGKQDITVRQVLSHSAGLHRFGTIVDHSSELLDWDHMTDALAAAAPVYPPGTAVGYHALTFGWLVGEIVHRISGVPIDRFVQDEIAKPLGLEGLYIGCPTAQRHRIAPLEPMLPVLPAVLRPAGRLAFNSLSRSLSLARSPVNLRRMANALFSRGMEDVLYSPELLDAAVPAMNGHFDAVSLARMYAMLAGRGRVGDVRILSRRTVARASEVQNDRRDRVLVLNMHWRLGYHRVLGATRELPQGFGHYGLGGSGAWADPENALALAMVCNRGMGTPIGDRRIYQLTEATAHAVANRSRPRRRRAG
jgi:CubicO group peptidase (beta-lactamase class C family)